MDNHNSSSSVRQMSRTVQPAENADFKPLLPQSPSSPDKHMQNVSRNSEETSQHHQQCCRNEPSKTSGEVGELFENSLQHALSTHSNPGHAEAKQSLHSSRQQERQSFTESRSARTSSFDSEMGEEAVDTTRTKMRTIEKDGASNRPGMSTDIATGEPVCTKTSDMGADQQSTVDNSFHGCVLPASELQRSDPFQVCKSGKLIWRI